MYQSPEHADWKKILRARERERERDGATNKCITGYLSLFVTLMKDISLIGEKMFLK